MNVLSVTTEENRPYRAGFQIGQQLSSIEPEVVIFFLSVHYQPLEDVWRGLQDGLGSHCILFGGTGDGYYNSDGVFDYGISAIGINTNGRNQWEYQTINGVSKNSEKVATQAMSDLLKKFSDTPSFCLTLSDFNADGVGIAHGINRVYKSPVVGGFVSDDRKLEKSYVITQKGVESDCLAFLACSGDIKFSIMCGSGWIPQGEKGLVQSADGKTLKSINGESAIRYFERQAGKPLSFIDQGVIAVAVYDSDDPTAYSLRSISNIDYNLGQIEMFGSIETGQKIKLCVSSSENIAAHLDEIIKPAEQLNFHPKAGVIISCAGRKWLLGDKVQNEVHAITQKIPDLPIVGFPSLGEISPVSKKLGSYSETLFHNVTYSLLLVG